MIIGGCAKENMETKAVELYQFEGNSYIIPESDAKMQKNKSIALSDTQCPHYNAGIVKNVSFDYNKMCIGSGQNVEIYDLCKDVWTLTKNTNKFHSNPQLFVDTTHRNIVYIASNECIEWMDVRKANKFWTVYKPKETDSVSCYNNVQIV